MKRTITIIGTIFVLLLLIFSSMPGVQAVSSQPPGSGVQAVSPQAPESGVKISALLSLQVDAKVRAVEAGGVTQALEALKEGRVDILQAMQAMGMEVGDLNKQRVFIHLSQEPTPSQIDELEAMGITPYPDSWIPPVGEHPTGFIVADMPIDKLQELAEKDYVVKLDTAEQMLEPQNDLAATKINANDVWVSGYDGTGVRIAVLDSGLDTTHPDIPAPVASKDYSNWPVLDDTIANTVTGHGTHVTGSALGRGTQSSGVYKGSAPDADLIFLKIGNDTTGGASYDAQVNAIKAAVDTYNADIITMSYGGWSTYHDGTSEPAQAVDYAVSQGAVVFISAGNDADDAEHYSGIVTASSTTGFIQINVAGAAIDTTVLAYNLVWYDGTGTNNDLELEYYNSSQNPLAPNTTNAAQSESSRGTEQEWSNYDDYVAPGDSTYYVKVKNNSPNSQFYHIYYDSRWNLAGAGTVTFQNADPDYTIGSPADADSAIAVGAYTTRKNWTDYQGTTYFFINPEETVDIMSSFSSRGPRVDTGAPPKPNIVAPGSAIISARDTDIYTWPGGANAYFIDNDGLNLDGSGPADYYVMQGTSMASPIAAGAAALLLEAQPALKGHPADVRNLLQSTATSVVADDNIDGYGLLDIQAAITALGDTTPPTVSSVSPLDGATGVAVGTTVSVTFSEAMDAATITTSSFTLGSVAGSVSYDSGTYTATFTPSAALAENTTYTATLSTAITDAAGNPLASAYSWSFITVQTVIPGDANGDGNVNALDITKVERIIAGLDAQTPGADANQDGNVNALDITKVERIIAGLD